MKINNRLYISLFIFMAFSTGCDNKSENKVNMNDEIFLFERLELLCNSAHSVLHVQKGSSYKFYNSKKYIVQELLLVVSDETLSQLYQYFIDKKIDVSHMDFSFQDSTLEERAKYEILFTKLLENKQYNKLTYLMAQFIPYDLSFYNGLPEYNLAVNNNIDILFKAYFASYSDHSKMVIYSMLYRAFPNNLKLTQIFNNILYDDNSVVDVYKYWMNNENKLILNKNYKNNRSNISKSDDIEKIPLFILK